MPKREYKIEELWGKKASIFFLREDYKKSYRELSMLLGCSRATLTKFIRSSQYQSFRLIFSEDKATEELIRLWPELDPDTIEGANRFTWDDVKDALKRKYPELK